MVDQFRLAAIDAHLDGGNSIGNSVDGLERDDVFAVSFLGEGFVIARRPHGLAGIDHHQLGCSGFLALLRAAEKV